MTEGMLLSILGGLLGLAVTFLCLQLVRQIAPAVLVRAAGIVGFRSFLVVVPVSIRGVNVYLPAAGPTTKAKYTARSF